MFLALDVGNSAAKGGLFEDGELARAFSVELPESPSTDRASTRWTEVLDSRLKDAAVDQVGLASVVPSGTDPLIGALRTLTDAPITTVHPEMPLPFTLDYDTPHTLGVDRLAAAAAGWVRFGRDAPQSVLVVDAGTAVNYEVIHRDGIYQGGAIGAGPVLLRRALRGGTAQLPNVSLTFPDTPVGQSTRTALQSGIMGGFVDSVRGMVDRLRRSLPDGPVLVLTGGWGSMLTDHLNRVDHHDPHLVLRGIRLLTTMSD